MVFPYVIDRSLALATVTLWGRVHGRDMATTLDAIYRDAAWAPGFSLLWNCTWITQSLFETLELADLLNVHGAHAEVAPRCEIILVRHHLDGKVADMYAHLMQTSARPIYVCRSPEEARARLTSGDSNGGGS